MTYGECPEMGTPICILSRPRRLPPSASMSLYSLFGVFENMYVTQNLPIELSSYIFLMCVPVSRPAMFNILSGAVFDYLSRGTLLDDSILQIPKCGLANIAYPLQLLSGVFQGKVNICNSIVSTPFACYSLCRWKCTSPSSATERV